MIAFVYVLVVVGMVGLVRDSREGSPADRRQAWVLVAVATLPLIASVVDVADLSPFTPDVDLAPLAFGVGVALVAWILLRERFLEIVPLASDTLLHTLPDGVLVIDRQERVGRGQPGSLRTARRPRRGVDGPPGHHAGVLAGAGRSLPGTGARAPRAQAGRRRRSGTAPRGARHHHRRRRRPAAGPAGHAARHHRARAGAERPAPADDAAQRPAARRSRHRRGRSTTTRCCARS